MIRTASLPAALLGLVAVIGMAALISVWGESQSATAEKLIQQEPHAGDTVAELPHQLLLTFDRPLALLVGAHTVTVTDSEGHELNDGPAQIATYSARTLVVPLEGEVQDAADISVSLSVRFQDSDGELFALDESYGFRVDPSLSESELAGEAAAGGGSADGALQPIAGALDGGDPDRDRRRGRPALLHARRDRHFPQLPGADQPQRVPRLTRRD